MTWIYREQYQKAFQRIVPWFDRAAFLEEFIPIVRRYNIENLNEDEAEIEEFLAGGYPTLPYNPVYVDELVSLVKRMERDNPLIDCGSRDGMSAANQLYYYFFDDRRWFRRQ